MAYVNDLNATEPVPGVSLATPRDYFELLKPRVMQLVVFTALVGMVMAPGSIDLFSGAVALFAITIGAGASGALNMWYDADIDRKMARTRLRPVPSGRVAPGEALAFGIVLSVGSVALLGLAANWLAAGLLAFTIFFYAVIYTMWLKRSTPENIVIGGAAGALPPVVGWAVLTGAVGWESLVLFAIIFLWTPPHFWALALLKEEDYRRANVPMLPNVAGAAVTAHRILYYSLILAPVGVVPSFIGLASPVYGVIAAGLGAVLIWKALPILRSAGTDRAAARGMFGYSLVYLFVLFAALLVEGIVARLGWF
ncbi:MAG: heme o synthase [Bauldia sp.]|nr:heme o synthase [Bauldia sp.]